MAPKVVPTIADVTAERQATDLNISFIMAEINKHPAIPMTEAAADHHLALANDSITELSDQIKKIINLKPADLATHQAEYMRLRAEAVSAHSQLHTIKAAFPSRTIPIGSTGGGIPGHQDFRLPRIDLPTFDGTITNWVSFRDMFVTAVDANTSLSKAQKLTYLKSRVTGEALRQINSIIICDANYDIAWDLLNSRYHSERELFFSTMQRFQTHSSSHQSSSSSIRSIVDGCKECISALEKLSLPTNPTSEAILMYHMTTKMDFKSKELWEQSLRDSKLPKLQELYDFLEIRARSLASSESSSSAKPFPVKNSYSKDETRRSLRVHHAQSSSASICKHCNKDSHPLFRCPTFNAATTNVRYEFAKKSNLCLNCLYPGHATKQCKSLRTCRTCQKKHHSLLHLPRESQENSSTSTDNSQVIVNHVQQQADVPHTLLATALIKIQDSKGITHVCRALLDGGASASFITEDCVQRLSLHRWKISAEIRGLSSTPLSPCRGQTHVMIGPHFNSSSVHSVSPLILTSVTCRLPTSHCNSSIWSHLNGLQLADPQFHTPSKIDILLGSDVFWALPQDGKRTGPPGTPIALNSTLGWLVAGAITRPSTNTVHVHYVEADLDKSIQRLWELDQVSCSTPRTPEEEVCEQHFTSTHRRMPDGRLIVKLPLKQDATLGDSKSIATRRFMSLERRLSQDTVHQPQYLAFMREYIALGHMELLSKDEELNMTSPSSYIPHHWVLKHDSSTTKFRVVFDASCRTSNGKSLNDIMMIGPTIQDGIVDIITRFRRHKIAFTADVAKMYRQVLVDKDQCNLQLILWRETPDVPIKTYRLLTVTYGTASAPFLATRALQQIASGGATQFPKASKVLHEDAYVDDVATGDDTVEGAIKLQKDLRDLLNTGRMELRKFNSNCSEFLSQVPIPLREHQEDCDVDFDPTVKSLGLRWNTKMDYFHFKVTVPQNSPSLTKRIVTSHAAKLFDPLGWLCPVLIVAKCLIQSLWKLNMGWDDTLPSSIINQWNEFAENLHHIQKISIPRCISPESFCSYHLYGFSDASEKAYAAVVYVAAINNTTINRISIINAKTRVAPAKQVSIPRLELCSAHLLSNLLMSVREGMKLNFESTHAFSDSTITLAWISSASTRWKTFVANRVADIQRNSSGVSWHHVRSEENPADCASRGITAEELSIHPLWWNGPSWLSNYHEESAQNNCQKMSTDFNPTACHIASQSMEEQELLKEERLTISCHFITEPSNDPLQHLITKVSSWNRLRRITGWLVRFINNCKCPKTPSSGPLSTIELRHGETLLIISCQRLHFFADMDELSNKKQLHHNSKLLPLNPFLDESGVLRVGGRLCNASMPHERKYPAILPRHSSLTQAIITSTHEDNLHSGPQLTLSTLTRRFWIVRGRDAVRLQLSKCIRCHRLKRTTQFQMMGNLPSVRVNPSRPFLMSGVDYAGPFIIRPITRGKTQIKAYICLIVCLTTHAIHLELVSSLSTEAFLAAFRRFVSRRGLPKEMWSDCGTNFIGAEKELKTLLSQEKHNHSLADQLSKDGVKWIFNPPGAPHFGGIWEAGVKSVKHHLRRVLSTTPLTFEEFTTVLCQVEACLNSRPITPISSNPEDLEALSPGHFLIGAPLRSVPDPNLYDIPINRVSRWQLLQRLQQEFWKRWSGEHLTRLQQRPKWMKVRTNLISGDMVIIKEENIPPQQWKLGRVITVYPGADGLVRVATIRTSSGELKRPITKLSLLPIDASSVETSVSRPAECSVSN